MIKAVVNGTDFLADLACHAACDLVLVLKSFDVMIVQVDLAFEQLDQETRELTDSVSRLVAWVSR